MTSGFRGDLPDGCAGAMIDRDANEDPEAPPQELGDCCWPWCSRPLAEGDSFCCELHRGIQSDQE